PPVGKMLTVRHEEATAQWPGFAWPQTLLRACADELGLQWRHRERFFDDFAYENLLPHRFSQNGPDLAVGDLDGDGREDVFVGGAAGQAGAVWLQTAAGTFAGRPQPALVADAEYEDMGAALFDADGDGDLDLFVVSGSNEYLDRTEMYQDRLYLNDGRGGLQRAPDALPRITASGSCVVPADFDGDGDQDLFVGGRLVPQAWPQPARSYLLRNEGGRFVDVTEALAPGLARAGLVTTAAWADHDGDGDADLWVAGEWMPLRVWENEGGSFTERTEALGLEELTGWWYALYPFDPDGDGDLDLLAGNMGLNYRFQPRPQAPLEAFYADFDGGGGGDVVLARWENGKLYPVKGRDNLSERLKFIRNKYPSFAQFGAAEVYDIFGDKLEDALHLKANTFTSCWFENRGNGQWQMHALPAEAQWAPIMDVAAMDVDGDGKEEWLVVGNLYGTEVETPRMDAGVGAVLRWTGEEIAAMPSVRTGFYVPDDARAVAICRVQGRGVVALT
ncbi:MAG: VCBS repeat-containing protein, partial [Alphaproteobacteria bacterium]